MFNFNSQTPYKNIFIHMLWLKMLSDELRILHQFLRHIFLWVPSKKGPYTASREIGLPNYGFRLLKRTQSIPVFWERKIKNVAGSQMRSSSRCKRLTFIRLHKTSFNCVLRGPQSSFFIFLKNCWKHTKIGRREWCKNLSSSLYTLSNMYIDIDIVI